MTDLLTLKFRKYLEITKISYYSSTAFIADILGIAGLAGMRIWMFKQLYAKAFMLSGATQLGGLDFAQTIWILALTQSFHMSNRTRTIMKAIEEDIKGGGIVYTINKPYSYLLYNFYNCIGVMGSFVFITVFFAIIVAALLVGLVKITFIGLLLGLFLLITGYILNSLGIVIIGLSAFWAEDVSAFRWIYDKLFWVFGGIFLPPSLIPDKFRWFIEFLPFNQIFYGPARLMISFDTHLFYKYLVTQLIWIIVFASIATLIYRKGVKNLSINGG